MFTYAILYAIDYTYYLKPLHEFSIILYIFHISEACIKLVQIDKNDKFTAEKVVFVRKM